MKINRVKRDLEAPNQIGETLSVAERVRLEVGLYDLQSSSTFDELSFWGRVRGTEDDYYIAIGLKFSEYEFPAKALFYATSNFHFQRLPPANPLFQKLVEELNDVFTGKPDTFLAEVTEVIVKEPPPEVVDNLLNKLAEGEEANTDEQNKDDAEAEEEANKSKTQKSENELNKTSNGIEQQKDKEKAMTNNQLPENDEGEDNFKDEELQETKEETRIVNFRELDRLAFVVRAIEVECSCVPLGSLKMTIHHQLRYNDRFSGLDSSAALSMNNWLHFRQPISSTKRTAIEAAEVVFQNNFLDDISADLPKNCWSLQLDISGELVS